MKEIVLYILLGAIVILGVVIIFKEVGWPSEEEQKNKGGRSIKAGFGGTMLCIGMLLFIFYRTSPNTFWDKWSFLSIIGFVFYFMVPLFVILTIGSYIQFSSWEKIQPLMNKELQRIVKSKTDTKS